MMSNDCNIRKLYAMKRLILHHLFLNAQYGCISFRTSQHTFSTIYSRDISCGICESKALISLYTLWYAWDELSQIKWIYLWLNYWNRNYHYKTCLCYFISYHTIYFTKCYLLRFRKVCMVSRGSEGTINKWSNTNKRWNTPVCLCSAIFIDKVAWLCGII